MMGSRPMGRPQQAYGQQQAQQVRAGSTTYLVAPCLLLAFSAGWR